MIIINNIMFNISLQIKIAQVQTKLQSSFQLINHFTNVNSVNISAITTLSLSALPAWVSYSSDGGKLSVWQVTQRAQRV